MASINTLPTAGGAIAAISWFEPRQGSAPGIRLFGYCRVRESTGLVCTR